MSRPSWVARFAMVGPPLALATLGVAALGELKGRWSLGLLPLEDVWLVTLSVLAIYTSATMLWCVIQLGRQAVLSHTATVAEKRADYLQTTNAELRTQIELLAAMREVTRVVTNDVDFERILEDVLRIVEGLLETEAITIYLIEGSSDEIVPQAQRRDDATYFGTKIRSDELDLEHASEAYRTQSVLRLAEDDVLHLFFALRADRECLGVLELMRRLEGSPERRTAMVEHLEHQARDMAEHIAVAIKTSHLHDKTIIDGLTQLYSKRYFMEQMEANTNLAGRHQKPFSLIMVDVDHFKRVNDTYGHLTGDTVLVGVARMLKKMLRRYDSAYRYGGEELSIILPETNCEGAAKLAERTRQRVEKLTFTSEDGRKLKVTASFGVASYGPGRDAAGSLIGAADAVLYRAKETGRNRVCVAPESS